MSHVRTTGSLLLALATAATSLGAVTTATASPAARTHSAATRATAAEPDPAAAAIRAMTAPRITWTHCGGGLQCGTLEVPLDYDDPSQGVTHLPITRRRADDLSHRIGSVFTNPGGPGGPASLTVPVFARELGPQVRRRFDIVGIGPRGVEGEDLAVCTGKPGEAYPMLDEHAFPLWDKEFQQHFAFDEAFRTACRESKPRILDHMTTADTARDMDLARRALGDTQITYYGISYGSYLGETYAALFPRNIRALVVDGVLDPVAWATGRGREGRTIPVTERLKSHLGAHEALQAAFAECEKGGPSRCPQAATVRKDWEAILTTLSKGPVDLGDGMMLRYDDVIALALQILYSPDDIPMLMPIITDLRQAVAPSTPARTRARTTPRAAVQRLRALADKVDREHPAPAPTAGSPAPKKAHRTNGPALGTTLPPALARALEDEPVPTPPEDETPIFDASFHGVLCSDSVNPTTRQAWLDADRRTKWQAPGFGPAWLWQSSACMNWPGSSADAYRGPFTKRTNVPVLIIGNEHDPATPYSGAVAYRKILPTSRLVTLKNGFGHGALGVSRCVDKVRTAYLVNQSVPAGDVTCRPDRELFAPLD